MRYALISAPSTESGRCVLLCASVWAPVFLTLKRQEKLALAASRECDQTRAHARNTCDLLIVFLHTGMYVWLLFMNEYIFHIHLFINVTYRVLLAIYFLNYKSNRLICQYN